MKKVFDELMSGLNDVEKHLQENTFLDELEAEELKSPPLARRPKDDVEAYGTSEGVKKEWDERGRGRKQKPGATVAATFTDNQGKKTQIFAVPEGGNLDTSIFRKSIKKDADGLVICGFNPEKNTIFIPNAGRFDADHANFMQDVVEGDFDLGAARGVMDINDGSISWYDMTSKAAEVARNAGMQSEERARNILQRNLDAARSEEHTSE